MTQIRRFATRTSWLPSCLLAACATFAGASSAIAVEATAAGAAAAPAAQGRGPIAVKNFSVGSIVKAWSEREVRLRSAVFEWTERRTVSKSMLADDETLAEPDAAEYGVTSRLSFDRGLVRFSFKKSHWTAPAPEGGDEYVGVYNGKDSKVYFPPGYVADYPRGHVSARQESEELTASYLKPFLWAFRVSQPRVMLFAPSNATLSPQSGIVDGRECLVLTHSASPAHKDTVWVDPEQDFSIVRHATTVDDRLVFQFDIRYRHDPAHKLWLPETWQFVTMGSDGKPQLSVDGELESYSLNPALSASEFEFAFPAGTWVHDGSNTEYIVNKDGPHRPVAVTERRTPYADLIRQPGLSQSAVRWLIGLNVAVLLAIAAFLAFRWQNWKRSVPN